MSDDFLRRIDNKQLKRFASLSRAADVQGLGAGVDVHVENGFLRGDGFTLMTVKVCLRIFLALSHP